MIKPQLKPSHLSSLLTVYFFFSVFKKHLFSEGIILMGQEMINKEQMKVMMLYVH